MRLKLTILAIFCSVFILSAMRSLAAQEKTKTPLPQFEAASVKPMDPNVPHTHGVTVLPGGRVVISGMTLRELIMTAFDVSGWQISGDIPWISKDIYRIEASPGPDSGIANFKYSLLRIEDGRLRGMLQALLIDRFQLKFHRSTKTGTVYLLERTDKPLKLRPIEDRGQGIGDGRSPSAMAPGGIAQSSIGYGGDKWAIWASSLSQVAKYASDFILRVPVLDRTNVDGVFEYRQDVAELDPDHTDPSASFLRFLSEIGLQLKRSEGDIEMLIIDSASKPLPN